MFIKTFTTTMKRIFRSPAMLFSIPAILIMLQQRTQIITKSSSPDFLFIQGGFFYQIYSATPRDYVYNQMLFNAILISTTPRREIFCLLPIFPSVSTISPSCCVPLRSLSAFSVSLRRLT